jgi:TRAP-type C4-dicarboxylate transport system permease small subunit
MAVPGATALQIRLHRLAGVWALLGGGLLLAIVAVTMTNVGAFALDRLAAVWGGAVAGLPGYEDFVRLAVGSAATMLLPYCQARGGHVSVDLLAETVMPARLQRVLDAVWLLAMAGLALFLAQKMAVGLVETYQDGVRSRVLGWPEWPFYAPGVASLLLWAAVALADLVAGQARLSRHG